MIRSELRATVSSGLTRPPTRTGSFPNFARSTSFFATFGGIQFPPIQPAITSKMIQGVNRFMPSRPSVFSRSRRDEFRIGQANRRRRSRTRHRARESLDCERLEESLRDHPAEIPPDKTFRRDNA